MSKVSRSVYQKVVEENKSLKRDIHTIVRGDIVDAIKVRMKWEDKFSEEERFWNSIKQAANEYFKDKPSLVNSV